MITIRKLATLKRDTRLRKIVVILQGYEADLRSGKPVDLDYLAGLESLMFADEELPVRVKRQLRTLAPGYTPAELLRLCNSVRHDLLVHLGAEPADWDFLVTGTGQLDAGKRTIFPINLYLDDIRSPFNVGSILRCAESFGVSRLFLSDATPLPSHPRARKVSMGCWEIVPWEVSSPKALEAEDNLFAMETGGTPIEEFAFPDSGTLIVGSEELGVNPELLSLAEKRRGRVSIPLYGAKASLNVAQALGIVLYRWSLSLQNSGSAP